MFDDNHMFEMVMVVLMVLNHENNKDFLNVELKINIKSAILPFFLIDINLH